MDMYNIYCDGSFRDGKSGFGIRIINGDNILNSVIFFGAEVAIDSYDSEIAAIKKSLIIFKEHILCWLSGKEFKVKIHSDLLGAVNELKTGDYKKYYNNDNLVSIKKNKLKLFELIKIIESFPEGSISFKKSKRNNQNLRMAHKSAKYALKNNHIFEDECYFLEKRQIKSDFNLITTYNSVNEIDVEVIKKLIQFETVSVNKDYKNNILIPVDRILVTEKVHLDCMSFEFNGQLRKLAEVGEISNPIFIREIEGKIGYYSLVGGAAYLFSSKILGIKEIPTIITELTSEEFVKAYSL